MLNRTVKLLVFGAALGFSNVASALPPCATFCQCGDPLIRCDQQCTIPGQPHSTCGAVGKCKNGFLCGGGRSDNFLDTLADDALCAVDETVVPEPEKVAPRPAPLPTETAPVP
jgi:hypothetical protein